MNSNSENSPPHEGEGDPGSWERLIYLWLAFEEKDKLGEDSNVMTGIFNAALKARRNNLPIHLLIFVIKDKVSPDVGSHIYILDLESQEEEYISYSDTKQENALIEYSRLMKGLKAHTLSKDDVAKSGGYLVEKLIPDVISGRLQNKLAEGLDKVEWGVWIYSNDDNFNPLWEWLYTSQKVPNSTIPETSGVKHQKTTNKKSSRLDFLRPRRWQNREEKTKESKVPPLQKNQKEEGFFWGDRVYITRIPKSPSFHLSTINNAAILIDKRGCSHVYNDIRCIHKSCVVEPTEIELANYNGLKGFNDFDCIHVAADGTGLSKKAQGAVREALSFKKVNSGKYKKTPSFLFLNICRCNPSSQIQLKLRELISAITWIDTGLAVREDFAPIFAEEFYKKFCGSGKNVAEAATETREEIKNRDDLDDCTKFLRLAYIVNGNPFTKWR